MDKLAGMAAFAKVVETGGFSAAARILGLSKSAVSKLVSGLEDGLGARLLNRTTRRLGLTEVGAAFHQRVTRILAEVAEAEEAVARLHGEPRGTLRLNAPMSFGVLHVAPALSGFMSRHPALRVDMVLDDRVVDVVEEGFDVAVRIAHLPDSSLIARRLAPCRMALCATPEYWHRQGVPARPEDLRGHNCLLYSYLATPDAWRFQGADGPLSVRVSGSFAANNGEALRAAALEGLGVALVPTFIVGVDLRAGRLQAVLPEYSAADRFIHAVYPHNRHLSAKVRVFIDFLVERFGPTPYWDRP